MKMHIGARGALAATIAGALCAICLPLGVAHAYGQSTLDITPNPVQAGESTVLRFTTSVEPATGEKVRFTVQDQLLREEPFDSNVIATAWTPDKEGMYTVEATIVDADGTATETSAQAIAEVDADDPNAAQLTITASPTAVLVDENVKLTATIDRPAIAGEIVHFSTDDGKVSDDVAFVPGRTSVSMTVQPNEARDYTIEAQLISAKGEKTATAAAVAVNVSRKASVVTVKAPGTATANTKVAVSALVASNGSGKPTGAVEFHGVFTPASGTAQDDVKLGTDVLDATGTAKMDVTVPNKNGTWALTAKYLGDKTHAPANTAVADKVTVTGSTSDVTVTLTAPATAYVGTATTLTAIVRPSSAAGKIGFYADGKLLSGATNPVTVSGGYATFSWKPDTAGDFKMTAKYTSTDGTDTAVGTDTVTKVSAAKVVDTITVKTSAGATLSTTTSATMTKGQSLELIATAKSGAKVTLTASGDCDIEGTVLTALTAGSCSVKATSPGAESYATTSATYPFQVKATSNGGGTNGGGTNGGGTNGGGTTPVSLKAQTAKLAAPATSKPIKAGSSVVLAAKAVKTNAGNTVKFTSSTPSVCTVSTSKAGKSMLKAVKAGKCQVSASAAGKVDAFHAYSQKLAYTIKK